MSACLKHFTGLDAGLSIGDTPLTFRERPCIGRVMEGGGVGRGAGSSR